MNCIKPSNRNWQEPEYDLIVIGGGINGVAIARDATLRGLKTILFEKHDFACGASSKSSKLVHGGLRYLERYHFGLVRESLEERSLLLRLLPHQVKLLPFIFPVYSGDKRPLWMVKLGLTLYDLLSTHDLPKHSNLSAEQISKTFPDLKIENLQGGCLYYDAQMLDHRIVMSNLASARQQGCVTLNYTAVTGLYQQANQLKGVYYRQSDGETGLCRGKVVVNATGAWSNQILKMDPTVNVNKVNPTKGIHLILPQIHPSHALILAAPQDSRIFFLIPWNGYSLLGTTDTPYQGDPDHPEIFPEDIEYLLTALNHFFPKQNFGKNSILASYAGLRPLPASKREASNIDRKAHTIAAPSGLLTLIGGKYTTYRKTAQEVVDRVIKQIHHPFSGCQTDQIPFLEHHDQQWVKAADDKLLQLASPYGLSLSQMRHLIANYGSAFWEILKIIKSSPDEGKQICPHHPHVYAEITYAIQNEQAVTLEDWFERRTQIAYLPCRGLHCITAVAEKFSQLLHWDENTKQLKTNSYRKYHSPSF